MRKPCLAIFLLLGGCMGQGGVKPLKPLEIATAPWQQQSAATVSGSLMYEGGCLLFRDDASGAITMPVWPAGSTFNGTAVIFHEPGRADQRVLVAQAVQLTGAPLPWGNLAAPTFAPIQRQCGAYAPFFVSTVRPAD